MLQKKCVCVFKVIKFSYLVVITYFINCVIESIYICNMNLTLDENHNFRNFFPLKIVGGAIKDSHFRCYGQLCLSSGLQGICCKFRHLNIEFVCLLSTLQIGKDSIQQSCSKEGKARALQAQQREQELTQKIQQMEAQHDKTGRWQRKIRAWALTHKPGPRLTVK